MAKLNLDFYKGQDYYSDGAVENELLDIVQQHRDLETVLKADSRWPIMCHFSRERRNLLEWFPFNRNGVLLEIGAGCGALTGLFCEKLARVKAVELSEKRSRILYHRYEDMENLEILAGNLMEMEFTEKFDYITLIGVLEYTRSFIESDRPYHSLLGRIHTLLKPEGILFAALENKFGLKYFAGAKEDHTRKAFDGIEGYLTHRHVETFSKDELITLFGQSGYSCIRFYYPYPDYKMPVEIFSDEYLPEVNHILQDAPNYDHDRLRLFSEKKALVNIIRNNRFDFFSNSFLVQVSI